MSIDGQHPLLARLNISMTGPIVGFFVTLILMIGYMSDRPATSAPTGQTSGTTGLSSGIRQPTVARSVSWISRCAFTGVVGYGAGFSPFEAQQRSLQSCVANGGLYCVADAFPAAN